MSHTLPSRRSEKSEPTFQSEVTANPDQYCSDIFSLVSAANTFSALEANVDIAELGDAQTLRDAVRELPDGQRQAIELLKLQELSLKEAAETSGTSVGALKVATHRAMATLRRTLGSKRS